MGAYEQKLYIRRDDVGNVAKQTKALYCTEHHHVNTEATSIESGLSYPGRSASNRSKVCANTREGTVVRIRMTNWYGQKSAEVVVLFFLQEGPNVRMAKEPKRLWQSVNSRNPSENYLPEDRTESKSKSAGGAEPSHATSGHNAGKEGSFFLVVCWKK